MGDDWNEAARTVRTFFPNEGYEEYLLQATPAHGEPLTTLPTGTAPSFVGGQAALRGDDADVGRHGG